MRKKKQLLKQLFCMALTLALLLGFVPGAPVSTARAEGTSTDPIPNTGEITEGTYSETIINTGTIRGGTFNGEVTNVGAGTITGGTFNGTVTNYGTITGGTFNTVVNDYGEFVGTGTISNGTFNGGVTNHTNTIIEGGIFKGAVSNYGSIGAGTFSGNVNNQGTITGGSFESITYNSGSITSTNGSVTVNSLSSDNGTVIVNGTKHTHAVTEEYRYLNEDKHNVYNLCKNCPVNYVKSVESYYHQPGHYINISASELQDVCPCNSVRGEIVITAPAANTLIYDGTAKEATVSSAGSVYNCKTITYTAGEGSELTDGVPVNAGTYTASVKISNDYAVSVSYMIAPISLAGCTITLPEDGSYSYNGAAVTPVPIVTLDGRTLVKDTDYIVDYSGNDAGRTEENAATLIIMGIGNYCGIASANYTITPGTYTPSPDTYETTCGINVTTVSFDLNELIPLPENESFSFELGEITATAADATKQPGAATGSIQENGAILTVTLPESRNAGDVFSIPVTVTVTSGNYAPYDFTFQVEIGAKKDRTLAWSHQALRNLYVEYGDGKVIDLSDYIVLDTSEGSDLSMVTYSAETAPDGSGNPSWVLNGSTLTPGDSGVISITATLPGDDTYNTMTGTSYVLIAPREPEGEIIFTPITEAGKTLADVSWTYNFKDKDGNPLEGTLIWHGYDNENGDWVAFLDEEYEYIVQPGSVEVEQGIWYEYFFELNNQNYSFIRESVCLYPEHIWSYTADGNVLTAECTDDGCDKTVTMALEMASYFTGDYEPGALQGVEVKRSDEANLLLPKVYAEFEVKNAAGEYERWNDMMLPEPVNAGFYRASITFGGVTAYLEYEVAPKPLTDETVTVDMASTEGTYTGSSQVMPELVVKDGRQELFLGVGNLIKNTDYTITYYRMVEGVETETEDFTNAGVIYVEVTGIGNYTGTITQTFIIRQADITAVATTDTVTEAGEPNWKKVATITAPEGYTIATTPDGAFDTTLTVTESSIDETGTEVTYYVKQEETGYVSVAKTITVYVDAAAPEITDISQGQITETTAELSWTVTDNRAVTECKYICLSSTEGADVDSVLEYGTEAAGEAGKYSLYLEELEENMTYYVHVAVSDALGNAIMETITFTTASLGEAVTPGVEPEPTPEVKPTVTPGVTVTPTPTSAPTVAPTVKPTATPTPVPTTKPTAIPTPVPADRAEIEACLFNAAYYAMANEDVAVALGTAPSVLYEHWLTCGKAEGRSASLVFDAKYYLQVNSDVAALVGSDYEAAYEHFVAYGLEEGRESSPVFDVKYYLRTNTDVAQAFAYDYVKAANHFSTSALAEGRSGSGNFDYTVYRYCNTDVAALYGDDIVGYYIHYINYGRAEGRTAGFGSGPEIVIDTNAVSYRIFDKDYYLENYPALARTVGTTEEALYRYWLNEGIALGHVASPVFNPAEYLEINTDVAEAVGSDLAAATNHFFNYGIYEGRTGVWEFDYTVYKYCNTDVVEVFGEDIVGYYFHYVKYGRAEGRTAKLQ